jgi:hypothetical protein
VSKVFQVIQGASQPSQEASQESSIQSQEDETGSHGSDVVNADDGINDEVHAQIDKEIERKEGISKPENSHTHCPKASQPSQASQNQNIEDAMAQPDEEPILRDLPEMPEEPEDDLDIVSEKELESLQEPSKESSNPIVSIEHFFSNDAPLENHSIAESPCFPQEKDEFSDGIHLFFG